MCSFRWVRSLILTGILLAAPAVSPAVAECVIKIDCCKAGGCYIIATSRFGRRHQAKTFATDTEARAFIKKLSPRIKNMHPRPVEIKKT